jgi:uncharacterized protein (TIGR02453 family)
MYTKKTFQFLKQLKKNNSSEWFAEHRGEFVSFVQQPSLFLAEQVLEICEKKKLPFRGQPKKCLFRLNRDVRFSNDKSPYKTHQGIVFSPTGEKSSFGCGYLHIEPTECFVGGGFWMPESAQIKLFRRAIADHSKEFLAVAAKLSKKGLQMSCEEKLSLKSIPRGFDEFRETPVANYLKWKSYTGIRPIDEASLVSEKLPVEIVKVLESLLPLLEFGWKYVAPADTKPQR